MVDTETKPEDRKLDWIPAPDYRSRNFSVDRMPDVAAPLDAAAYFPPRTLHRGPAERIDQGEEGACVPFSNLIALMTAPIAVQIKSDVTELALQYYEECREIDGFPPGTEGTSLNAGAHILRKHGWIDSWWWAFGVDQVLQALRTDPVILGVNWYSGMYQTDNNALVHIRGNLVGGHAITATGYRYRVNRFGKTERHIRLRNSWGLSWGNRGDGWISESDLDWLLRQMGEAMVLKGQKWIPTP